MIIEMAVCNILIGLYVPQYGEHNRRSGVPGSGMIRIPGVIDSGSEAQPTNKKKPEMSDFL